MDIIGYLKELFSMIPLEHNLVNVAEWLLGGLVIYWIFKNLFVKFIVKFCDYWIRIKQQGLINTIYEVVDRPLKFIFFVLILFFAVEGIQFGGKFSVLWEDILRSLVIFGVFWFLYALTTVLQYWLKHEQSIIEPELHVWILYVLRITIVATTFLTILPIWGIHVAPFIAGFGLLGVAVALGAQDLFKNILGGITIIIEKRFKIGDAIIVEGVVQGTVDYVGLRSSRIIKFDTSPVVIPNSVFAHSALTNLSQMRRRRIYWKIGLEYSTTIPQFQKIREDILDWVKEASYFVSDGTCPCSVYLEGFGDSSIDMMIYCFTKTTQWQTWLEHKQSLAYAVKSIVESAGTGFAFPSRTIYQGHTEMNEVEVFIPPKGSKM